MIDKILHRSSSITICWCLCAYRKEAELLSRSIGAKLIKTSVKEDINVNAVFWYLATQCLAEIRRQEEEECTMTENGLHPVTIS